MPPLGFTGCADDVREALMRLVEEYPRARVVTAENDYIHAEFTSAFFRFVDDVELVIDAESKRVHFRSASRTGYSDLGVNRRRMRGLCQRLCARGDIYIADSDA